jgi:hypothetical protein
MPVDPVSPCLCAAALDRVSGWDGWDAASPYEGTILIERQIFVYVGQEIEEHPYDKAAVQRLAHAVGSGSLVIEATLGDPRHSLGGRTVRFEAPSWLLQREGELSWIQALDDHQRRTGPVYGFPRFVAVGATAERKQTGPRTSVGKTRIGEIADELLADPATRPPFKRGWRVALARLVRPRAASEGQDYEEESLTRRLRELQIRHPDETG